jgi:hypothetical protein
MKIRPVRALLYHTDRQTDGQTDEQAGMTKLTVAFRNFVKAPKNYSN